MSRLRLVNSWQTWVEMGEYHGFDPYAEIEFGIDLGGGNSQDYEYTGDYPKCTHENRVVISQDGFNFLHCPDCQEEWDDEDI